MRPSLERREFLAALSLSGIGVAFGCAPPPGGLAVPADSRISRGELGTIEAVQDLLLPSGPGSPGARDVEAGAFLLRAIEARRLRSEELAALGAGARRLDLAAASIGYETFAGAPPASRAHILRAVARTPEGGPWVSQVLRYTLEAFFADPIHGGNPGGICWAWAGIRPPEPRPEP